MEAIRSAVDAVPASVFEDTTKHGEIGRFDASIAEALPQYEGDAAGGYNPNCKLWSHLGFDYSVDLYNADKRITIEVEKTKLENISDDLLKFQKGYRTKQGGHPKIEFGCLVVPVNYRGSDNRYQHSLTKHDFLKGILFIDDIAVISYRDPRSE